jgi:hypothetical protein
MQELQQMQGTHCSLHQVICIQSAMTSLNLRCEMVLFGCHDSMQFEWEPNYQHYIFCMSLHLEHRKPLALEYASSTRPETTETHHCTFPPTPDFIRTGVYLYGE